MLRIAVIGGGGHSRGSHLPALARYCVNFPGGVELAAFCDLEPSVAESVSREYGFHRSYTDVEAMLTAEALDGCIAVTPIPATAGVARRLIAAGIPLLMEKPPGATRDEARQICEQASRTKVPVMVSMNRRYQPSICSARSWSGGRPIEHLKAAMYRADRREETFFVDTALHALDTMRAIAGEIEDSESSARRVDGTWWHQVEFTFTSGATGRLEVCPTRGVTEESYEWVGPAYRVLVREGRNDSGQFTAWEDDRIVIDGAAQEAPMFVRDGAYDETLEFLGALQEVRVPHPSPEEVWPSVDLCHTIHAETGRIEV